MVNFQKNYRSKNDNLTIISELFILLDLMLFLTNYQEAKNGKNDNGVNNSYMCYFIPRLITFFLVFLKKRLCFVFVYLFIFGVQVNKRGFLEEIWCKIECLVFLADIQTSLVKFSIFSGLIVFIFSYFLPILDFFEF